ncbi:MAG: hypothetical protein WCP17_03145 [bacterium]
MNIKNLSKKRKIWIVIILITSFILGAFYFFSHKDKEMSAEQMVEYIKEMEAKQPPRIGKTPTFDQIYESPYIHHIRVALNGYLDGTNKGVEGSAFTNETDIDMKCGLKNFDKDIYKGKFVVVKALDNDYGGIQADIVFVDNPKTVFWVWIYQYGTWVDSDTKAREYVMRAFCEEDIKDEYKSTIQKIMDTMLKEDKNFYLL